MKTLPEERNMHKLKDRIQIEYTHRLHRDLITTRLLVHKHDEISVETTHPHKHLMFFRIF